MDMDPSSGQSQEMQLGQQGSLENMLVCSKSGQDPRKARPAPPEHALKCPRCDSTNTKFCYYNNYSLTQPRYFCKSCRRYWTKGGTLRNVPVGGGCRKNKRSSSSSTSSTPTSSASSKLRLVQDQPHHPLIGSTHLLPPNLSYDSNDLTLAFARLQKQQSGGGDGQHLGYGGEFLGNPNFLDALRSGFLDTSTASTTNNNHHQLQNLYYGVNGSNYGMGDQVDENGEMVVMPYEHQEDHEQMINGGGSSGATTQAVTVTTMKQEFCNNNSINNGGSNYNDSYGASANLRSEDDQSKILWGFPWQMNGNNNNMGHLDHSAAGGRSSESWINGINGGSTWHGLLNSPLM